MKKHLLSLFVFLFSLTANSSTFEDWTSSNTADGSTSEQNYVLTVDKGITLSFDWFVSSEENYDFLEIYLDDYRFWQASGEYSGSYTIDFTAAGTRNLLVRYSKDDSSSGGNDNCGISNIRLTKSLSQNSDVDGDGTTDVADVTCLVSIILGSGEGSEGDIDGDGVTDVADVTTLVGIILGTNEGAGTPVIPDPSYVGEAIDLGLPSGIKWANCNVGATSPEECGAYYAWGETEEKNEYSWKSYKHLNYNENMMSKYWSHDDGWGIIDNKTTLDAEDDVAQVHWGNGWRMPSSEEQKELYEYCNWDIATLNGVEGIRITGPNGNSIFLPATGFRINTEIFNKGSMSYFWSNTVNPEDNNYAYVCGFNFASGYGYAYADPRINGWVVRPVFEGFNLTVSAANGGCVSIENEEGTSAIIGKGQEITITATPDKGYEFDGWYDKENTLVSEEASYTFTMSDDIEFTAKFQILITPGDAIDLGLPSGVKWGSRNIDANLPEEPGGCYAWGETVEKEDYSRNTYKFYDESTYGYSKYILTDRYDTPIDGKAILETEDDVAHVKLGGAWRMPTVYEIDELLKNCTWEWITRNGVYGYGVTGPNGNTIFLPAADGRDGTGGEYGSWSGRYWSSNLCYGTDSDAYGLEFSGSGSGYQGWRSKQRYIGRHIRPVLEEAPKARYSVTASTMGGGGVAVNGSSTTVTIFEGNNAALTAAPFEGWEFAGWYTADGKTLISTNPSYTFVPDNNASFVAKFNQVTTFGEVVDLGLACNVKWASCNVGAKNAWEAGDYFAWGETVEKEVYSDDTYKFRDMFGQYTKYCTNISDGTVDGKTTLDPEDDVAHARWGGEWRMPTDTEISELFHKCTWEWEILNGVNGYRVTGPNGNSIFLPVTGYRNGSELVDPNTYGLYLSSSMSGNYNHSTCPLDFTADERHCDYYWGREIGGVVRPVCGEYVEPQSYIVSVNSSNGEHGTATIVNDDNNRGWYEERTRVTVQATPHTGYEFAGWYDDNNKKIVSTDASYTFVVSGETDLRARFHPIISTGEVIDLGLPSGLKWASCNIGSAAPEETGTGYAWGEIKEKESFSWGNYKFADDPNFLRYSKYVLDDDYGTTDGKVTLELIDDIARGKLGGTWRLPTKREMQELVDNCTWEFIERYNANGITVEGYRVTGPNGNSIFLPFTHTIITHIPVTIRRSAGLYWTSSLSDTPDAYILYCIDNNVSVSTYRRYSGLVVRPVCE